MSAAQSAGRGHYGIIPALSLLAPLLSCIVPRAAPALLPILAFVLIVGALRQGLSWRQLLMPGAALAACLAFALYLFINATWAWDAGDAFEKAAFVLIAVLLAFAAVNAISGLDAWQTRRAAVAFLIGMCLGALYLAIELLTEGALRRGVMNSFAALRPEGSAKHMTIVDGRVTQIDLSEYNQNISLLTLNLWSAVFVVTSLAQTARRKILSALLFVALAFPIVISEHDSSVVALVAALLVFLVALYWPRATLRGVVLMWCFGFALILPATILSFNANLHLVDWLPSSYRARVIIWEYTAEQTLEQPWLGIGVNSTTNRDNAKASPSAEKPEGFVYQRTTGHHAHDVFLQTWYELGLAGAILLALAGALVVLRIGLLPLSVQPFAEASFVSYVFIAAFAWGMWQTWFMAGIALVPLYVCMVAAAAEASVSRPSKAAPVAAPAKAQS